MAFPFLIKTSGEGEEQEMLARPRAEALAVSPAQAGDEPRRWGSWAMAAGTPWGMEKAWVVAGNLRLSGNPIATLVATLLLHWLQPHMF